jgi:site-specific recombinase XerD
MPSQPPKLQIVPTRAQQLDCVNGKTAKLVAAKPQSDIYGVFALSARLARQAVDSALEIEKLPGIDLEQIQPALNFWYMLENGCPLDVIAAVLGHDNLDITALYAQVSTRLMMKAYNAAHPHAVKAESLLPSA